MTDPAGDRVSRLIGRLAGIAALLITFVPPLAFLLGDYEQLHGALDADARTQAALVSQTINRNPGVWQFAHERLKGGLAEVRDPERRTRIVDTGGALIAELPAALRAPVIEREAEFFDFGAPAGVVRVSASFRPALLQAALVLAISAAVGGLLFLPLRRIPLAALRRANEALADSEQRSRTIVNGLREGVLLVDTEMRVLAANPGAARILGVPEAAFVGADLTALFDRVVVGADGEPLDPAQWPLRRAIESGEPQEDFILGLRRPGRPNQWLQVNVQAIAAGAGNSRLVVASFEDQTEAIDARERLMLTDQAFQSTADAIFVADAGGNLVYVNRAFATITGFAPEESIGRKLRELGGNGLDAGLLDEMAAAIVGAGTWRGDFWSRRQDGQPYAAWLNINAVRNDAGRLTHIVGSFSDITERVRSEERIRDLAQHDILTGLPNRAMLRDSMGLILAGARRRGGEVGVFFVDLDHFKAVNDSLGHAAGDQVLIEVGRRLTQAQRDGDLVSRLAGDEFVVVVPDHSGAGDLAAVADRVLNRLSEPFSIDGHEFLLTPSIGISVFPADGGDVDELLSNADTAMYAAKENGRANFRFFSAAMNSGASTRLEIANAVRRGLEHHEFILHYQPQIEVGSGRLCGVEALIRWNHPERGLVAPGAFIPVVEGTRLIIDIGEWVLAEAARQARAWQSRGWTTVPIAVNISALHFRQDDFVARLTDCIGSEGMPPGSIEIEITESLMIDNPDDTRLKMQTLVDMGFALSLDDFGTGYSSLAYLTRYPFQQLKIDQSFVRRIADDATTLAIVEAIIALAHAVDLVVLAEGVETEVEADLLRQRGCDQFQGYLFARPMPAAALEAWLQAEQAPVDA